MTINPPESIDVLDCGHHCAGCTERIPATRRWYLALYQLRSKDCGYTIVARYVCPRCNSITELSFRTSQSNKPFMDYLNLYTDTYEGSDDQGGP